MCAKVCCSPNTLAERSEEGERIGAPAVVSASTLHFPWAWRGLDQFWSRIHVRHRLWQSLVFIPIVADRSVDADLCDHARVVAARPARGDSLATRCLRFPGRCGSLLSIHPRFGRIIGTTYRRRRNRFVSQLHVSSSLGARRSKSKRSFYSRAGLARDSFGMPASPKRRSSYLLRVQHKIRCGPFVLPRGQRGRRSHAMVSPSRSV